MAMYTDALLMQQTFDHRCADIVKSSELGLLINIAAAGEAQEHLQSVQDTCLHWCLCLALASHKIQSTLVYHSFAGQLNQLLPKVTTQS